MTDYPEDDLTAAEYVLGTLDDEERTAAERRRVADAAFDGAVVDWERRLSSLSEATREIDPPAHLWPAILQRLGFTREPRAVEAIAAEGNVILLSRSRQRWRRATGAMSALAACLAALLVTSALREARPAGPTLVAYLQKTGDAPAYLMKADLRDHTLAVKAVAAKAQPGRSYELWIIDPQLGPPKSLGVLDTATGTHTLPGTIGSDVLERATYAVTNEQAGGSPDGKPTGAPIFVGHLVSSTF